MKIICIVQARMGSERLPGKVMRPILGKPMIAYTLERLKKSRYIDEVVLATSVKDTENEMVEYLESQNYQVFRGSEDYVLERYVDAVKKFGGDIVIRITGDCPLIDPVMVDQIITYYLANDFDYVGVDTMGGNYIRGFDVEMLRAVGEAVSVPIIASGGAGCREDFLDVFRLDCVDAGLAASIFHSREVDIRALKRWLNENGVPMRLVED